MTDRELHKMMLAMTKEHWRSIDPQWKEDPELCHALGYEAGYNDAVARRVEPRLGGSGAGFESLPASSQWKGLTDEEIESMMDYWSDDARSAYGGAHAANGEYVHIPDIIRDAEARLKEKNNG